MIKQTEASLLPFLLLFARPRLSEPSGRVGEQGVNEARFRREMAPQHRGPALVARDFVEQALEFRDVAINRLLEVAVGAIFADDLVERLLASRRVEALGERLALASLIAVPHLCREIAIHQPPDVQRQRLQGIATGLRLATAGSFSVAGPGVGAVQQLREPSIAALVGIHGR